MTHITIIAIGKIKSGPEKEWLSEYHKRLGWKVAMHEIEPSKQSAAHARKQDEAKQIRKHLPDNAVIFMLDERGKSLETSQFAQKLQNYLDQARPIVFIIGGADGLETELRQQAQHLIAFGAMTWPHKMVRVMLMEQLYRAWTLSIGHPYHRE